MKPNIVLIGAGNLATHLAKKLYDLNYRILQVYSRSEESAKKLANAVNAMYTTDLNTIIDSSEYYIFSIKDSILESLIKEMPHSNGIWIHTAGSISLSIFEQKVKNFGVLYPLQTFSKSREAYWSNIPLFIEGSNENTSHHIKQLADKLSDKVYYLSSKERMYIHVSAIFACNFTNHMYEQAMRITKNANLPFDILLPLIDETSRKVHELSPNQAQTGPAVRFDINVMNKHLEILKDKTTTDIYKLLSESIYKSSKKD